MSRCSLLKEAGKVCHLGHLQMNPHGVGRTSDGATWAALWTHSLSPLLESSGWKSFPYSTWEKNREWLCSFLSYFMTSKQANHPHPSPSCYSPSFWFGVRLPPYCVRTGGNSAREAPRRRGWNSGAPSEVVQSSGVNDLMRSQDSIHCLEGTLLQEGSSNMKPLSRSSTPAKQDSWVSGWRLPGDSRSPLTFQSSTASSRKMRIPTSKLMAMIHPTT